MNVLKQAEDFISELLKDRLSNSYCYHNFNHTLRVVNAVKELMEHEISDESEREILLIAAWFHDSGYIEGSKDHEDRSSAIAASFLTERGYDQEYIAKVTALIGVTKMNGVALTPSEKIIKDSDYSHFALKEYIDISELLRKEWEGVDGKKYSDYGWLSTNFEMMSNCHQYYTHYAQVNWQPKKEKNIGKILRKMSEITNGAIDDANPDINKKNKDTEKSVDTMFKITLTNHIRLSEIADSKANILLSVNAIIISIALSTLIPKLDSPSNAHLIKPTFVLIFFSVLSIIFAILSTKPKVTSGQFTRKDIEDKKVNLLFFGNFFKMPYEEFEWAMKEMINDKNYLRNSMTKDLYYLGLVLERKYRLLRITYNIFMVGIIISVIAFVFTFQNFKG